MKEEEFPNDDQETENPVWKTEDEELVEEYKKRRRKLIHRGAALIILLSFLAFSYAWFPLYWSSRLDFLQENQTLSGEAVVQKSKPSVVYIQALSNNKQAGAFSQGTGFNIAPEGLIVTNRHVAEEAVSLRISFDNENRFFSQDITFIDDYDLAVIRLADNKDLPYLTVLTDKVAEKGQKVIIIGNPLGFEDISIQGNVCGYYRLNNSVNTIMVIDASIKPGSSGSPVLDEEGLVVGIVFATGEIDIEGTKKKCALAIPSTALKELLEYDKSQK